MRSLRMCVLACLVFFGNSIAAQDLKMYLEQIKQNPAYQAAYQAWKMAEEKPEIVSTLPDPTLMVGVFAEEVQTRVGPQKQRVSLSQAIPWKGELVLKAKQAQKEADRKRIEMDVIYLQLSSEFKALYADLYFIGRSLSITEDHLALLREMEQVITEKYETNSADYHDLLRIQIEIDALEDRLASIRDASEPIMAQMKAILGNKAAMNIPLPQKLPGFSEADRTQLLQDIERNHPLILSLSEQIEVDRLSVDLAQKDFYPDFKIGVDWINTGQAINPVPGSGNDAFMLSVGVNLPIWRGKYRANQRAATSKVMVAELQKKKTEDDLTARLQRGFFQLDESKRKLKLYGEHLIPKAQEALEVIQSSYATGNGLYSDLIKAEQTLLEFLLAYSQAEANQVKALVNIESLTGSILVGEAL